MAEQIFISYSKKNWHYAHQIYNHLLWDGYLVWIDQRLKEGEKWRPQIDHNLKASKRFLVLISPEAIDSKWVHHETSMACGRDLDIIPVQIKEYKPKELPLGVEEVQLFYLTEGGVDYDRELKRLKNRLGPPVAIVEYMESLLIVYETSGCEALLSEHQLRLYEKHKEKIVWPKGKEALGRELVEKSYRALQNYWEKYEDLEENYLHAQREIDQLKQNTKELIRFASPFVIIVYFLLALYVSAYLLK
jgi:hypothetical protein